jgi:predicted nucleotidyltransferase
MSSMSQVERERILATARETLLAALPDAWAIYVLGSFARGEEWPGSDLDMAVLLPPPHRIEDPLDVMSRLSAQVHREVDIVMSREPTMDSSHLRAGDRD